MLIFDKILYTRRTHAHARTHARTHACARAHAHTHTHTHTHMDLNYVVILHADIHIHMFISYDIAQSAPKTILYSIIMTYFAPNVFIEMYLLMCK